MAEQSVTIKDAAKICNVSKATIRRKIKSGEIQAEKKTGKYGIEYTLDISELKKIQPDIFPEEKKEISLDIISEVLKNTLIECIYPELENIKARINSLETTILKELGLQGIQNIKDRDEIKKELHKILQARN